MSDTNNDDVLPSHRPSAQARMQRFEADDAALEELAARAHQRALSDDEGANAAGHLDLKIRERRAAMWGYDAPVRTDMVLVAQSGQPKSFDQIKAAVLGFIDRLPPEQKALRQRLEQMSAAEALERLGLPKPIDGNGAKP